MKQSRSRRFKKICTGLKHLCNSETELDKSEFVFNPHKTLAYLCAQSSPTLCNPISCSLPGSSVHGISQARILEWVILSCSRGSAPFRDWTHISCIGRWILYHWATWEAPNTLYRIAFKSFFKCLIKFIREDIWNWGFLYGKVLNYEFNFFK